MKNYYNFTEWINLIVESKQNIVNLGYPEIIAKLFYKKFGKYAYLLSKWYRDYRTGDPSKNWFSWVHSNFRSVSLVDLIDLYNASTSSEAYIKALEKLDITPDEHEVYDQYYLQENKENLMRQMEDMIFSEGFFNQSLATDIISGKLKNVSQYKDMSYWNAQHKYDEKSIFQDRQPLKVYNNGFKWIDVGKRCMLVGHLMKNCGSAGVMSMDEDRTMIALFDPKNLPHVVVTYSPNQKRISGDEGIASTEVKSKYHRYVLDLSQLLGAKFDAEKTKSKFLKLKSLLQGKATGIQKISGSLFDEFYKFNIGGQVYYTNAYTAVSQQDMLKAQEAIKSGQINLGNKQRSMIKMLFNHLNQPILAHMGVKYILINQL